MGFANWSRVLVESGWTLVIKVTRGMSRMLMLFWSVIQSPIGHSLSTGWLRGVTFNQLETGCVYGTRLMFMYSCWRQVEWTPSRLCRLMNITMSYRFHHWSPLYCQCCYHLVLPHSHYMY